MKFNKIEDIRKKVVRDGFERQLLGCCQQAGNQVTDLMSHPEVNGQKYQDRLSDIKRTLLLAADIMDELTKAAKE